MDVFDELRQSLETRAKQAAIDLAFTIIFDEDDAPKSGTYVHFWYETGKTEVKLGGGRRSYECTPGVFHFNIYTPEKQPSAPAVRLADALKRRFNRVTWLVPPDGHVSIEAVSVQRQPIVRSGFKIVWAEAGFDFHHRDSAAVESFAG